MIKKIAFARHREKVPSPTLIAASSAIYVGGAVGIGLIDRGFLLTAWLMSVFLAGSVYLTLDARGGLFNVYTVFFGGIVAASTAAYFLT